MVRTLLSFSLLCVFCAATVSLSTGCYKRHHGADWNKPDPTKRVGPDEKVAPPQRQAPDSDPRVVE